MSITFVSFAKGLLIRSADFNSNFTAIDNALFGVAGYQFIFLSPNNATVPVIAELSASPAADQDVIEAMVSGAASPNVGLYIRSADQYGGIRFGTNTTISTHLYGASNGVVFDQNILVNGTKGLILNNVAINGETAQAIIIEALAGGAGSADLYLTNPTGNIYPKVNNGAKFLISDVTGNALSLSRNTTSHVVVLYNEGGTYGVGIRNTTKQLAEFTSTGNMIIAGTQYGTTQTSSTMPHNQTFDTFDFAEIGDCDQAYPNGTVVCLQGDYYRRCTHPGCALAQIISYYPGYSVGQLDTDQYIYPLALVGKVRARVNAPFHLRGPSPTFVVSDGAGGVRPATSRSPEMILGVVLTPPQEGYVGILLSRFYHTPGGVL